MSLGEGFIVQKRLLRLPLSACHTSYKALLRKEDATSAGVRVASQAARDLGAAPLLCGDLLPEEAKMLRAHGADSGDTECSETAAECPGSCFQGIPGF